MRVDLPLRILNCFVSALAGPLAALKAARRDGGAPRRPLLAEAAHPDLRLLSDLRARGLDSQRAR